MGIVNIVFEPGFMTIHSDTGGPPVRRAVKTLFRAEDIPDLTLTSMTLLTTLANLVEIIVRTLIRDNVLNEELVIGYNIDHILESLTTDLGTDIGG